MLRAAGALLVIGLVIANQAAAALYPRNPLLHDDSIYLSHQGVYRFDHGQAEPAWTSLPGVETFAPVIQRDLLLVGSTRGLYALHTASGEIAWHIEKQHTLFTPMIAQRAFAGSVHGELYAIEPHDGAIDWRRRFDGWIYSPAADAGTGRLWTGGQAHALFQLASEDGALLRKVETSQESVFSPVDLGSGQIGVNLFDGSSVVITGSGGVSVLPGDSLPSGIMRRGEIIYRGHGDGRLAAFARADRALLWQRKLVPANLTLHPSLPGTLLLSDGDRNLLLFDLERNQVLCRLQPRGEWLLPLQTGAGIAYAKKSMNPPRLRLVQQSHTCK